MELNSTLNFNIKVNINYFYLNIKKLKFIHSSRLGWNPQSSRTQANSVPLHHNGCNCIIFIYISYLFLQNEIYFIIFNKEMTSISLLAHLHVIICHYQCWAMFNSTSKSRTSHYNLVFFILEINFHLLIIWN